MATTVAFAGSGRITVAHGLALQALGGVKVLAVASRDPAHAAERAGQMHAAACGYDDLPAGADVVIVATPPARHAADVVHALGRGASVIVEKPLCTTLAEADALVAAAGPGGGGVGYAENLAFAPVIERALEITSGLGELRHLEVRALSNRPNWGDFLRARLGWWGAVRSRCAPVGHRLAGDPGPGDRLVAAGAGGVGAGPTGGQRRHRGR